MKKAVTALLACLASVQAHSVTNAGFGLDAFNRSISAATKGNAVFSPASFDFDCVVFSEGFGALTRAKYAEKMGALNGLEAIYKPLYDNLTKAAVQKFSFLSARAFCLPDERKVLATYRQWMQGAFSAEAFSGDFRQGAECWFRARLDGDMEDFSLPTAASSKGRYSYYDLVSFRCSWKEPFPTNNTRIIKFHLYDGAMKAVPAMCDLRVADVWKRKRHSLMRLPMADDSWLFALLPDDGVSVRDIRGELTSEKLLDIISGINSITETGISHDPTAVVIPIMDVTTECDLKPAFGYFQFPISDMDRMEKSIQPNLLRQRVRFRLDEKGMDETFLADKPGDMVVRASKETRRFVLNRPFLFFVFHQPTLTIPVVGQFMGM